MDQSRVLAKQMEIFADVLVTVLAFLCVYVIRQGVLSVYFGELTSSINYYFFLLVIIIWYVTLDVLDLKCSYGLKVTGPIAVGLFKAVTICIAILVLSMYIFKIADVSRLFMLMFYIADIAFLILARFMTHMIVASKPKDFRYMLILGSYDTAKELIRLVDSVDESEVKIVGCIELGREDVGKEVCCGVKIIGTLDDLRDILLNEVIDEILIAMPLNEIKNSDWYLSFINTFGVTVRIIPYWYVRKFMSKHAAHGFEVDNFLSEPALIISRVQENRDALIIKSVMDYFLAMVAFMLTFPLFIIIPCFIKLFSPGPVFYKQIRCGRYGRKFPVFKFRTMILGAEKMQNGLADLNEASGPTFKIKDDPRIIPYIGTFLRKTSLDELPQFINVMRGEMSVVGPRPPIPAEVEKYELWQRRRLSMKPGITCIWQIQPKRNEISFEKWMDMDMDYIDHWSLWLDIVLILKTIPTTIFGHGR